MTRPDVGQNLRQCLESGYVHDIIPIESCKRATLFELRPPLHRIFLVIFFVDDGHEFEHHGHGLFAIRGPICFHLPSVQLQRQPRKWDVGLLHRANEAALDVVPCSCRLVCIIGVSPAACRMVCSIGVSPAACRMVSLTCV